MIRPRGDSEVERSKCGHFTPILADVKKPVTRLHSVATLVRHSTNRSFKIILRGRVVRVQCCPQISNGQALILAALLLRWGEPWPTAPKLLMLRNGTSLLNGSWSTGSPTAKTRAIFRPPRHVSDSPLRWSGLISRGAGRSRITCELSSRSGVFS